MMIFRQALLALGLLAAVVISADKASAQATASPHTSAIRYDANGRLTGTISPDPDGTGPLVHLASRNTYDSHGRLVLVEEGELATWQSETVTPETWLGFTVNTSIRTEFDDRGRPIERRVLGSDGFPQSVTQFSYDSHGRLECTAIRMNPDTWSNLPADACTMGPVGDFGEDRIQRTTYDILDRTTLVQNGYGSSVEIDEAQYTYWEDSNQPASLTDARGYRAEMEYDGLGQLERWRFPSPNSTGQASATDYEEYGYDAAGNRVSLRRRDGMELTYEYDALGRMTRKNVPDRPDLQGSHEQDIVYTYDLRGLQTSAMLDPHTTTGITTTYDGFGRVTSTSSSFIAGNPTLNFTFDRNGNRTEIEYPDGTSFTYSYDGLNRFDTVRRSTNTAMLVDQDYNTRGQLIDMHFFAENADLQFGYDNIGRQNQHSVRGAPAHLNAQWDFSRNPASQIVTENRNTNQYAWDQHVNSDRAYTVNGLNQYTQVGAEGFCYDDNGNLTADGDFAYQYDNENRLVRMYAREPSGGCPSWTSGYGGQRYATIIYDPMGRIARIVDNITGNQTYFLYDGDALVAEYSSTGTLLRRYLHGPSAGADDPLAWFEGSGSDYESARMMVRDPRGSIILARDRFGTYETVLTYDEYGIPGSGNRAIGSAPPRFQYTGQIWLEEFGLYFYKARVYSPTLGRFLQTDPIGYEDSVNLYAYVSNDPINGIDPSGMCKYNADGSPVAGICPLDTAASDLYDAQMANPNSIMRKTDAIAVRRGFLIEFITVANEGNKASQYLRTGGDPNVIGEITIGLQGGAIMGTPFAGALEQLMPASLDETLEHEVKHVYNDITRLGPGSGIGIIEASGAVVDYPIGVVSTDGSVTFSKPVNRGASEADAVNHVNRYRRRMGRSHQRTRY